MLQGVFEIGHLTLASNASQLPTELGALGETSCPEGMSLADQAS